MKRKQAEQSPDLAAIDDILDMARRATGAMVDKRSPKPTPEVVKQAEAEDELREAVEEEVVDDNADGGAILLEMKGKKKPADEDDVEPAPLVAAPEGDSGEDWAKRAVEKYQAKHKK